MDFLTVTVWILFIVLSGATMQSKGRSVWIGFALGAVLGVFGWIICLFWPKSEQNQNKVEEIK